MIVKNNNIEIFMIPQAIIKSHKKPGPSLCYKIALKDLSNNSIANGILNKEIGEKLLKFFDDIDYEVKD